MNVNRFTVWTVFEIRGSYYVAEILDASFNALWPGETVRPHLPR